MANEHRAPWDCVLAKEDEGVCHPGAPPADDQAYFEILCLCLLQAGLNWGSIRKHWPRYREGFLGFELMRLAEASPEQVLANEGVIKNRRKIEAIIANAREFLVIRREFCAFFGYLASLDQLPERERLKALTRRFKQVGPETADYFLHAVGYRSA
jgi:3-methyladenine DNA glycosylase Tag